MASNLKSLYKANLKKQSERCLSTKTGTQQDHCSNIYKVLICKKQKTLAYVDPFRRFSTHVWQNARTNIVSGAMVCDVQLGRWNLYTSLASPARMFQSTRMKNVIFHKNSLLAQKKVANIQFTMNINILLLQLDFSTIHYLYAPHHFC